MILAATALTTLALGGCVVPVASEAPAGPAITVPAKRPNVVLIMADDVGFAMSSAFGGPVPTPNMEALARRGLRYNRFNTTAQCSPSRAALLTGRNPHRVQVGSIVNTASDDPGYTSILPKSAGTIGDVLKGAGYATAWIGKAHVTPVSEVRGPPTERWPTGLGFDYFYGSLGGGMDQFRPSLIENTTRIPAPEKAQPGYILERDLTDRAIAWYRGALQAEPTRPFFLYYASYSVHAPQQAPADWIARFRGKFDQGWDVVRRETFERQRAAGIVPPDAKLTPRPEGLPAWDDLTAEQRALSARSMEVAAAQEAFFDDQLGRLFAALDEDGLSDNTLIILVNGDNGATQEGGPSGSMGRGVPLQASDLDRLGSADGPGLYNAGWGWAMNSPFPYYKHIASHLGGIRNGLTIAWPGKLEGLGSIRSQYGFVTDIAPTIYQATGVTLPKRINGQKQMSLDGISLAYTFRSATAPSRRREQYVENNGNRSFYRDGWMAATLPPKQLWDAGSFPSVAQWQWALYQLDEDFSQSTDVSAHHPEKLKALRKAYAAAERRNGFVTRQTPEGRSE